MTVDHEVLPERDRQSEHDVSTAVLVGYATAAVALFGWFLFGLLVQRQGFVDSVGESAGAGFGLLLAVSVIGAFRHNGR
ncbi:MULTISPECIES: hypothetical protein [Micromonospora]|uniref:Uncharacterized protein n=1 Tax=Micromonospora solifontis TaxID=2487138 RepID=A0ABX9WMB2_9ACTN|nr:MULTISPECIES: hypothetical protein [Micromonospora]NES13192.1 hypothetical protein [Micromonospora sp. PPF5-17B]NES34561.1 hypothetical protein [Micromonospora solifontis]NES57075.1 hypothetical protein [Micromonospora sp. PPF5-6]RNM01817.1 hypothetical protein EFE23_00025 [Micromonospora solifontis]